MKERPSKTQDELLRHLSDKTREICHGDYSGLEELYPYISDEKNSPELSRFTEQFVMMATKLEAREFDLNNRIEALKEKNEMLVRLDKLRSDSSFVFFVLILIISLFTLTIEVLRLIGPDQDVIRFIVFRATDALFIITSVSFIILSKLPLKEFGLTLRGWKRSLLESLAVTGVLVVLMLLIKGLLVYHKIPGHTLPLADFRLLDWTFLLYLVIAPLQEFMARGVALTSIERSITGRYHKTAVIILSALIFGLPHMTFSLSFALWGIAGGIIWGLLYMRHRTILGVSISHYLLGTMAFLCGFL